MITCHDDLVDYFVKHWGSGFGKLAREVAGEEPIDWPHREVRVLGQKTGEVDVVVETKSQKIAFELYYILPSVSNVIQKIKVRRERMPDNAKWVAVIPQQSLQKYGQHLRAEGMHVGAWYEDGLAVDFYIATR
jgi:hypothetical protein